MTKVTKEDENHGDGGDTDPEMAVHSGALGGFTEGDEIRALMASLPDIHGDAAAKEVATERFLGERPDQTVKQSQTFLKHML